MREEDKPYRERVEMLVQRGHEVLITVNPVKGGETWHGLPGGGVDPGENMIAAAKRETLEEVGVRVRNVVLTEFVGILKRDKWFRDPRYCGARTHLYTAEYDGADRSIYNKDEDAVNFIWCTRKEAYDLLKKHIDQTGGTGDHVLKYLETLEATIAQ